jgi:hypothetical protein
VGTGKTVKANTPTAMKKSGNVLASNLPDIGMSDALNIITNRKTDMPMSSIANAICHPKRRCKTSRLTGNESSGAVVQPPDPSLRRRA